MTPQEYEAERLRRMEQMQRMLADMPKVQLSAPSWRRCLKTPPSNFRRRCHPVIRARDGQRFESVHEAAEAEGVWPNAIRRAMHDGGTCAGSRWIDAGPPQMAKVRNKKRERRKTEAA